MESQLWRLNILSSIGWPTMAPVTPRSFRRFFAPRRSARQEKRGDTDRRALADVDPCALNQRRSAPATKTSPDELDNFTGLGLCTTPGRKRSHDVAFADVGTINKKPVRCDSDLLLSSSPVSANCTRNPERIRPSKLRQSFGRLLYGELGTSVRPVRERLKGLLPWQSQVAGFSNHPKDLHKCTTTADDTTWTLPFCSAACHTNSIVAVGDEDGSIRVLETSGDGRPEFSSALLKFRPHSNAILDLCFSSDDMLLATASGDQTAQIVDMLTQQTRYKLVGHHSTVKQIRFQPGSADNVLATSSRDGCIRIWDLRCKSAVGPVLGFEANEDVSDTSPTIKVSRQCSALLGVCVNTMSNAHQGHLALDDGRSGDVNAGVRHGPARRIKALASRTGVSVTALSFISASRPNFLMSGSEACANIKLWDLRMNQTQRSKALPLSVAKQPAAHDRQRRFGLTSLAVSADTSKFYALCRDSTAYVYSTSHLILGSCPEWDSATSRARRGPTRTGLGPIYGLRHPKLQVSSFYVKLAVRQASTSGSELLAVGSNSACPIVFNADDRFLSKAHKTSASGTLPGPRVSNGLPVYGNGAALVGGHDKEVTDVCWTPDGDLVSIGDDFTCRLWRDDREARRAQRLGTHMGQQCNHGRAELADWGSDGSE